MRSCECAGPIDSREPASAPEIAVAARSSPSQWLLRQAWQSSTRRHSEMEVLSVSALSLKRLELASRGASRGCGASRGANRFKMDANASAETARKPVVTSSKSTRCFRPKEWSREVEEGESVAVSPTGTRWKLMELAMHSVPSAADRVARPEGVHGDVWRAEPLGQRAHPVHAGQEQRVLHVLVRLGVGFVLAPLLVSVPRAHARLWFPRRPSRECDDKYLHTVKLFEYAG